MNHMLTHVSADQISIIKSTEFYLKRARHDDGNSSIDCYIHWKAVNLCIPNGRGRQAAFKILDIRHVHDD